MPLVSIIILNWNGKNNLANCLNAIRENSGQTDFETIVVDNQSKDGSIEILKSEFKWVRLLESPRYMGIPEATNWGFREAKGKYFFLLGNDTIVTKGWMENSLKIMQSDERIASVGSRLINREQLGKILPEEKLRYRDTVCSAAMLMKAKAYRHIGGYDEEAFTPYGGDETDWNYRARNAGYKVIETNSSVVVHFHSQDSKRQNPKQFFLLNRNRLRAMLFNYGPVGFLKRIPGLGLIFIQSIGEGTAITLLKTYIDNISGYGFILKKRKERGLALEKARAEQKEQGDAWF